MSQALEPVVARFLTLIDTQRYPQAHESAADVVEYCRPDPQRMYTLLLELGKRLPLWERPEDAQIAQQHMTSQEAERQHACLALIMRAVAAYFPEQPEGGGAPQLDMPQAQALASVLLRISSIAYGDNGLDSAEFLLHRIQRIWEDKGPAGQEYMATCLNNLGRIYEVRGDIPKGIALHRQALSIRQALLGTHKATAFSLGNLGVAYASIGQWEDAHNLLTQALDMYAALGLAQTREAQGYAYNVDICKQALQSQR